MHKDNLKIFTRVSCSLVPPSGGLSRFSLLLSYHSGCKPIQASKHHNILTISWIQINTSSKSKRIYKCSRMPNSSYWECSYW